MTADDLDSCMLLRASDLAHYMLQRNIDVRVTTGHTANGMPCTVVYAVGDAAQRVFEVAERIAREMVAERERRVTKAGEN